MDIKYELLADTLSTIVREKVEKDFDEKQIITYRKTPKLSLGVFL